MAESDWTFLTDGLPIATVDRGVTTGVARPNGGGSFLFGFNSLAATEGAVGLHTNQTDFSPLQDGSTNPTGGSVRGAIQRGFSASSIDFAPLLFIGLQGTSVNDAAYLLGLSDEDPSKIVLRKGALVEGIPDFTAGTSGILRKSSGTVAIGEYRHLRLDMVHNDNTDVVLKVFENDLTADPVTAPNWIAVAGMADFVDDALGVNSTDAGVSASIIQPFAGGRAGFGFFSKNITRRGFFDHVEVFRQL